MGEVGGVLYERFMTLMKAAFGIVVFLSVWSVISTVAVDGLQGGSAVQIKHIFDTASIALRILSFSVLLAITGYAVRGIHSTPRDTSSTTGRQNKKSSQGEKLPQTDARQAYDFTESVAAGTRLSAHDEIEDELRNSRN